MSDTTTAVNALLDALLPTINKVLPPAITAAGLDPWKDVVSGSDTLGKINLGICTASAKASYSIKDMTGLSSLQLTSIDALSLSGTTTITGTLSLAGALGKSLSAKVSGKINAKCGVISESVSISGKATAKGVTGKGTGEFTATLGAESCLTAVTITAFSLDYTDIDINIDGLGMFNSFMDPLVDAVDALFGDVIKDEVAKALMPVLNDLLKGELPLCITL